MTAQSAAPPPIPVRQYLDFMRHVRDHGHRKDDRTGTGTLSVFGHQMRFDLGRGFPLLTTKKVHTKSIVHELLWFLRGETNVRSLQTKGVTIWDAWADADGELGPIYGYQWRSWPAPEGRHIDQIAQVLAEISHPPLPVDCASYGVTGIKTARQLTSERQAQRGAEFNDNAVAQGNCRQKSIGQTAFSGGGAHQTRSRLLPVPLETHGPKPAKTLPTNAVQSIERVGIGESKQKSHVK